MKKIMALTFLTILFIFLYYPLESLSDTETKKTVVKIFTATTKPDYFHPWNKSLPIQASGSGCVIKGKRILTNAHVVSDQSFLQVLQYGQPKKVRARVVAVSHEADLALLTVEDKSFFKGVEPLLLGELPETQDEVVVYGFPEGGDFLSLTKGVISRIEHHKYVHSGIDFLAIQIDAAINAGNSGGPVISNNKIIGVAMQTLTDAESIGYIVPTPIIKHFIKDFEDGAYDGFPNDGIITQPMENKDMRIRFGLKKNESGIFVISVVPGFPAEGKIFPRDIILSLDGHDIANDGTVEFRPDERTDRNYFVQSHQVGEKISFDILRKEKRIKVQFTLTKPLSGLHLIPQYRHNVSPSYYIYGGLVFSPLTTDYLEKYGDSLSNDDLSIFKFCAFTGLSLEFPSVKNEVPINLINVLSHDINNGYHNMKNIIITEVNDKKVYNLKELTKIIESDSEGNYVEFKTKQNKIIVLNKKKAENAKAEIMGIYSVPADRSVDLVDSKTIVQ